MAMNKKVSCCLFGCLGTGLTLVFLSLGFFWFLTKTGDFEEEATVFVPDGQSYLRVIVRPEDEALIGLFADLALVDQEATNRRVPEDFRWLSQMGNKDRPTLIKELKYYTPIEFEMTYLGPSEAGEDLFIFGVGFGSNKNLFSLGYSFFRMALREEGKTRTISGKEIIVVEEPNETVFIHLEDGVFYFSLSEEPMRIALEGAQRQVEVNARLSPLYNINPDATLYGFLKQEALRRLPNLLITDPDTDDWLYNGDTEQLTAFDTTISQVGFDLNAEQDNQLLLRYQIFCDPGEAFASHLNEIEQRIAQRGIEGEFNATVHQRDYGYELHLQLSDISNLLRDLVEKAEELEHRDNEVAPATEEATPVETETFDQ
ncbi:hypothetical protein [Acanthopleuribacter pedis]|uniref:DUF4340 domain-containing protein n=1 Tax=Acanthopleuribacter pedis TaxID=442870 RepID=A0A8J7QB74_9BACT|nr:hypothetical protein [Acanthopleuribacter pedis]MBO1320889.1 hypothetical protein [Acanthopleuribacter pedis]